MKMLACPNAFIRSSIHSSFIRRLSSNPLHATCSFSLHISHNHSNFILMPNPSLPRKTPINQASKVHVAPRPAAVTALVQSAAAALVLDRTVYFPVGSLRAKDHDSPVRRLGGPRRHVHLGSPVLDRGSHLLKEVVAGRGSDRGSLSRRTKGEEGTGLVLDLAGWGESPSVVRVRRRCERFVVGVCRLGCSEEVGGSCFVSGCRRRIVGVDVACIGYKVAAGLVVGMGDSAGRSSRFVGHAVREGMVGSAGCRPVWGVGSWCRSSMEDLEMID